MRVSALIRNLVLPKNDYKNNQYDYSSYREPVRNFASTNNLNSDVFIKSTPTFTAIKSAGDLRNLPSYRVVHCLYCNRPMMSNKTANKLKANGVFSGPIKKFSQEMFNYLEYLHPTEKEVLKKITIMAFDFPNIRLSEAIKKLYPEANKALLKEQMPIIKKLGALADELPRGYKTKYKKLLQITKYRLEEKEYTPDEFSGKEFAYKIKRISDTIKDDYMAQRILKLTEPLTHPIFKYSKEPLTDKFIKKILSLTETRDINIQKITKEDLQNILISQIKKYGEILNRKDILNLCDTALKTIKKEPIKYKFSNKSFRYDLNEVLENLPNAELKEKIIAITQELPKSSNSVNAFITKHELAASDAIGYDIIRPSIATIEHMHPRSQHGADMLYNYALACERCNNTRSNEPMSEFIKQFDIKNQKIYFKEIFEEVDKNNISRETAIKMVTTFFNESGRNINIAEINKP